MLIDANLLIYAYTVDRPQHASASRWLLGVLEGDQRIGIPIVAVLAFVRITSNRSVFAEAVTPVEAWQRIQPLLAHPNVQLVNPGDRHSALFDDLLRAIYSHKDVTDAHLAALAIEHDLTLASTDGGFARFPGLGWFNPLAAS